MANLYFYLDTRSRLKDGSGSLKLAIAKDRKAAYIPLDIHLKEEEWDGSKAQVVGKRPDKKFLNVLIKKRMTDALIALQRVELRDDYSKLTIAQIKDMVARGDSTVDTPEDTDYVLPVYNEYITLCKKTTTAAIYRTSRNNLIEFEKDIDTLRFKDINVAWLRKYQAWLLDPKNGKGMETNGANVYLRNLRTIFNYALQNEFTKARYPFKDIDMSSTEPDKRMIPYEKFLEWATIPMPDYREFYRDLFMLSFYLCGIRPVDLLHVKKDQIQDGRLVYCPQKLNGKTKLSIKIEPEAWELIHKYEGKEYMLDIMEKRVDYKQFSKHWNRALRAIGVDEVEEKTGRKGKKYTKTTHKGIVSYITVYYARTCWATYAYNILDIPMDTISQALGHKSGLRVTNFYVKRDTSRADKANRALIDRVSRDMAEFKKKNRNPHD